MEFFVIPIVACTWLMEDSKSAAVFTAAPPIAVTAADATDTFFPAFAMLSPAFSNFPPTSPIFVSV